MLLWEKEIQLIIDEIDFCIKNKCTEEISLGMLAKKFGCSEFHFSRKFREVSGMNFRDYLGCRKLSFALKEVRDSNRGFLDIALDYGFSSHESFTHAFKNLYGVSPKEYRKNPVPVALRTIIKPFDCYLLNHNDFGGKFMKDSLNDVKAYFISMPAHKFLHIKNYESIGYWDFWQKQAAISGQDCETICGLLESIPGKLDDFGDGENNSGSGQLMAWQNCEEGRICSWGIPLAECYGVRLPSDFSGEVPSQMILEDVSEGEYIVFEHGPFDYETENSIVEQKIEQAMKDFDYSATPYTLDFTPGRFFYFYHDCKRGWKYVRPVVKKSSL